MYCKSSTALRCKRLWPTRAADAPTCRIEQAHRGHSRMARKPRKQNSTEFDGEKYMYWHKSQTIVFVIFSVTLCSAAFAECAISRHAQVPNIYGLSYDTAREQLIRAGWQPISNMDQTGGPASSDILSGNGEIFWKRGYVEVESCAGTGTAQSFHIF